jgi:hypothetical protein
LQRRQILLALPQVSPRFSLQGYLAALLNSDVAEGLAIFALGFFLNWAPEQG